MEDNKPLIQARKPQDRLSESFPPDTQNNYEYIANVHKLIKQVDLTKTNIQQRISIRNFVNEEDMDEIKKLHQEWFPLPYHKSYYDSILKNNVKSILVEFEISKKQKVIIGCLFYMSKACKQRYLQFRYKYLLDDYYGVYITTIGVINSFRSQGIAKIMMDKLKEICLKSHLVQYIYLHIVTYNNAGIKYYERNGFRAIEKKKDHYSDIEGKQYDAYVYIYFLNGSSMKEGFLNDLLTCLSTPFNSVANLFKSKKKI